MGDDVTREDVIEELQRIAEIVGRGPSLQEYKDYANDLSHYHIYELFDGINEARTAAGLSNSDTRRSESVPKEELLEAIHELRDELGQVPKREKMKNWERGYSEDPYRRVFGTWSEAVREAGYEPHRETDAERTTKECAYCGGTIDRRTSQFDESSENYFDSRECKDRYHEEHGGGEGHPLRDRVTVECSWCGEEKKEKPSVAEKQEYFFCDSDCQGQWRSRNQTGADHPRWKGGGTLYYGPNWPRQKRKARERDGKKCRMCGITNAKSNERMGRDLDVHHKKPVRSFYNELGIDPEEVGDVANTPLDWEKINALDNLVTLCLPCHRKVETLPVTPQFE